MPCCLARPRASVSPCTAPLCLYRFLLCFLLPSSDELENRLLENVETTFYDTSSKKPAATVQPFMSSLIASLAASGTSLRLTPSGRPRPAPASTGSWLLQVILSLGTVLLRGAWGWGRVGEGPSCLLLKGFPFRGTAGGQRLAPAPLILRKPVPGLGASGGDLLSPMAGLQGIGEGHEGTQGQLAL